MTTETTGQDRGLPPPANELPGPPEPCPVTPLVDRGGDADPNDEVLLDGYLPL